MWSLLCPHWSGMRVVGQTCLWAEAEVSDSELAPFRPVRTPGTCECVHGWRLGRFVWSTCGLDKSISRSRVKQALSRGWETESGLILHFRPHSPCLLIQACKSSICFWVSLSLSLFVTHTHTHTSSPSLLYTSFFTHPGTHPYSL